MSATSTFYNISKHGILDASVPVTSFPPYQQRRSRVQYPHTSFFPFDFRGHLSRELIPSQPSIHPIKYCRSPNDRFVEKKRKKFQRSDGSLVRGAGKVKGGVGWETWEIVPAPIVLNYTHKVDTTHEYNVTENNLFKYNTI